MDSGEADPDGDGWLFDVGGDIPCPKCHPDEYGEWQRAGCDSEGNDDE